jgi:predicted ester cyclase
MRTERSSPLRAQAAMHKVSAMPFPLSLTRRPCVARKEAALIGCVALASPSTFGQTATTLSTEAADVLVSSFQGGLTAPTADAIAPLLDQATDSTWMDCSTNENRITKAEALRLWKERTAVVPELHWTRKDITVAGTQIVMRGEASVTPATPFLGNPPRGHSFHVVTIDIHDVEHRETVRTYLLEDWMSAVHQLSDSVNAK